VEALKTALEGTYAMTSDERCKVFPLPPLSFFMQFWRKIYTLLFIYAWI
jgi:hypothetical protein